MWRAVTMAALLGLGWCVESPAPLERVDAQEQEVPGEPPQLPPLDAADDVFQPGYLTDPAAHFTFAARTDRHNARPQVLETNGNIVAYINRLSRPSNRTSKTSETTTSSSGKRNRGTRPPPLELPSFESVEENARIQTSFALHNSDGQSSPPATIDDIEGKQPEDIFTEELQQALVATTPKSRGRSAIRMEFVIGRYQPTWILTEQEQSKKITEEISTIRSRPTRPVVRTMQAAEEHERTTAFPPTVRRRTVKRKKMPLVKDEMHSTLLPVASRVSRPPPPPVPTLSPWIDGYGK